MLSLDERHLKSHFRLGRCFFLRNDLRKARAQFARGLQFCETDADRKNFEEELTSV